MENEIIVGLGGSNLELPFVDVFVDRDVLRCKDKNGVITILLLVLVEYIKIPGINPSHIGLGDFIVNKAGS